MTPFRQHFDEHGYAVLSGLLGEPDLAAFIVDYERLLDRVARAWLVEGSVADDLGGLPFGERFTRLTHEYGRPSYQFFDICLPSDISADTPIHLGDATFDLLVPPRLLDAVEALIGPEIYVNPMHHVRHQAAGGMGSPAPSQRDHCGRTMETRCTAGPWGSLHWRQVIGECKRDALQSSDHPRLERMILDKWSGFAPNHILDRSRGSKLLFHQNPRRATQREGDQQPWPSKT